YGAATMWDSNYQPKPAYNAAISALSTGGTTTGGTTGSTTTTGGTTGSTTTGGTTGSTTTGGTTGSTTTTGGTTGSTTGGTGGGCHVTYTKNEWTGGFTADVVVGNTGSTPVNGWTLGFSFPGDQKVTNAWNATVTQSGNSVTATNVSYDASIAPGATVDFGFQGTWASNDTSPSSFTLNGTACS
ncbi:cellulose binding domain-containing protein, partial [Streptomyces sp. HPF1205]|uniref:cellulose-binding domain-containing protein n=1 Tax=Streptomyces sp. HPF1205 TaxID=2873262 RepID=UPI0027E0739E